MLAGDYEPEPDTDGAIETIKPTVYAGEALQWVAIGATIVGGCCATTPAHIAAIKA